jgi:hypothetical protein
MNGNILKKKKNKCIYKKGLGNAHPALCSSLINILFYHSGSPEIFEHVYLNFKSILLIFCTFTSFHFLYKFRDSVHEVTDVLYKSFSL